MGLRISEVELKFGNWVMIFFRNGWSWRMVMWGVFGDKDDIVLKGLVRFFFCIEYRVIFFIFISLNYLLYCLCL